ncbi:autotransporter outer membrane beta-barrel domain-containing protein [Candidatus Trichorickettsia mobilis]|uniref:autotransporter outer membrane beta-barrel domain-containing protein n=1 Tax=Candidatus Trichorickettsia mobilis TaxID=1346319 RepID=UPI00293017B6|nr:autotransporter outer membrane beta-barrel domain-containing protein [Candidatus Trichorickettsia mobilis]
MTSAAETTAIEKIVPNSSGAVALMEASDISGRDISDRVLGSIPIDINLTEGEGVAAGDHDITKYGTWISPFYQKAIQKKYNNNPGYKVENYGGTIGFDTMVSEHLTLGLAWSYVKADLKHQGIDGTDKGNTTTNLFSLYGLTDMAHNYFISGLAAVGFSKVNNLEERRITNNLVQMAQSKYNSRIYSGKILGGKQCKLGTTKFTAVPMLGLRYSNFKDGSYQETGASIQNLSVAKKSSYNFESIIGAKIITSYTTKNNFILTPEVSAFTYINLKNKAPITHISNAAFSNSVRLEGAKTSKAWYSLGTALGITKNRVECNIAYEAQLDKKYIGHQGILKIRVNF